MTAASERLTSLAAAVSIHLENAPPLPTALLFSSRPPAFEVLQCRDTDAEGEETFLGGAAGVVASQLCHLLMFPLQPSAISLCSEGVTASGWWHLAGTLRAGWDGWCVPALLLRVVVAVGVRAVEMLGLGVVGAQQKWIH